MFPKEVKEVNFQNLFRDKDLSSQNIQNIKNVLSSNPKEHLKTLFIIIKDKTYPSSLGGYLQS